MNQPDIRGATVPPPPPVPSGAPGVPATPPDLRQQIMELIPQQAQYDGHPISTHEQVEWAFNALTQHFGGDLSGCLTFLRNGPVNLATLQQGTVQQSPAPQPQATQLQQPDQSGAPPNPVSDSREAPKAQVDDAPKAQMDDAPKAQMYDASKAFAADNADVEHVCREPECSFMTAKLRGMKTHIKKTHKIDWDDYAERYGLSAHTGLPLGQPPAAPGEGGNARPTSPPPPSPGMPVQATADGVQQAQLPSTPREVTCPQVPQQPQQPQQQPGSMPQPPAQRPLVTYQPDAAPPAAGPLQPAAQPQAPDPTAQSGPPGQAYPTPADQHADPQVRHAASLVQHVQEAVQQAAAATRKEPSQMRRQQAQMLGGEVDCVFVSLLDASNLDLNGRADVNALACLAEAEGVRQITNPEDLKYRRDRQIAERVFAELLTQHPRCYVLMNGYNMVLADNFFRILSARICSGGMVKGQQFLPFSL